MIHVRLVDQAVQGGVDAGGARVEAVRAVGVEAHHLVFGRRPLIQRLQRAQLVHIQRRKAIEADGADIAARTLDPQHQHVLPRQRIGHHDLGRGIAAAVVGDAPVGPEQVGAVAQGLGFGQPGGCGVVPARFKQQGVFKGGRHGFHETSSGTAIDRRQADCKISRMLIMSQDQSSIFSFGSLLA